MPNWTETFIGGSPRAEGRIFARLAHDMVDVQRRNAARGGRTGQRTLHAKFVAGSLNALLEVDADLGADLAQGHFTPGARLPAIIRFSNASALHHDDGAADMRGMALRLVLGDGRHHDLLATNFPVSHARDAVQFVTAAKMANGPKALILPRFLLSFGLRETLRIVSNVRAGSRPSASLASEQFWSRGAVLWGEFGPVRFSFVPEASSDGLPAAHDLGAELVRRLTEGEVTYRLVVQRYVDEAKTPIEDGATEWLEADAPFLPVGRIHFGGGAASVTASDLRATIDAMAFSPWTAPDGFRPLGNLNRARGPVYAASAAWRAAST